MKVFLIIVAILAVIIIAVLSLSATVTLVYDKGWHTKVKVLFIEKDIVLSEILSFILFPERKAKELAEKSNNKKQEATENGDTADVVEATVEENVAERIEDKAQENKAEDNANAPKKTNALKKLWDEEGIVGILSLVSNLVETANSAIITLIRGLHIYSLYVMIIVGGGDAADIARAYGTLCSYYYPVKGLILNGMRVDNYDDYIQPDFISPRTEFEFQLIASINIALLLKVALKAGFIFLKNFINNKKEIKRG